MKNLFLFISLIIILFSNNSIGQSDTLMAKELYYKGKELYADGEYKEAENIFFKALDLQAEIYGKEHLETLKTSRRITVINRRMKNLDVAQKMAEEGLGYLDESNKEHYTLISDFQNELGEIFLDKRNYKKSLFHFKQSLYFTGLANGEKSIPAASKNMNIGMTLTSMGLYEEAGGHYNATLDIFLKKMEPGNKGFNRIYFNMANLYMKKGNYDKAIEYGEKALSIKVKNYGELHPSTAKYFGLVGRTYLMKEDTEKALVYINKYVEIIEEREGRGSPEIAKAYSELAGYYSVIQENEKALELFEKAKSILVEKRGEDDSSVLRVSINIARVYEFMENYDEALGIHKSIHDSYKNMGYDDKESIAGTEKRIARVYSDKGNSDEAIKWAQKSIKTYIPSFNYDKNDFYSNPTIDQVAIDPSFLRIVRTKSALLRRKYFKDENVNDLKAAFNTIELALQIIVLMREDFESEASRSFLNSDNLKIYKEAILQANELFEKTKDVKYIEKAFGISEQSKASLIWQNLNERYAFESANIPEELETNILDIEQNIKSLKKEIRKNKDSEELKEELFTLKVKHEQLITSLEKINPAYYQLKYASNNIGVEELKSKIPNHKTAIVEYSMIGNDVFIFVVKKDGLKLFKNEIPSNLNEMIISLREDYVKDKLHDKSFRKEYIDKINTLYALLIEPVEPALEGVEYLNIVPDKILQYISFESLAPKSDQQDFRTLDYLIHNYNIQYTSSATLWANAPKRKTKRTIDFLGFAPDFDKKGIASKENNPNNIFRDMQVVLPHAVPEIMNANSYFKGEIFLSKEATETQFLEVAPKGRIIHLATHAFANDENPSQSGLFFSTENDTLEDGFLNTLEIYNLDLSADLAIMSACNTGFGQIEEGEGILSLGRAFSYAGCKSVIMSLWLANDESTSKIIKDFYKYSSKGFTKQKALRNAKLDYLQTADALTAHPFFWANLTITGDMTSLKKKNIFNPWYLFLIGILGLVFFFITKRRISQE